MKFREHLSAFGRNNLSRIIFLAAIVLAILIWNIYASMNDDGIVTGRVVTPDGQPAANATVNLRESTINLLKEPIKTQTDSEGRFRYEDIDMIEFVLTAQKEGYKNSKRYRYHLYFMGQNFSLPEPIVLGTADEEQAQ